MGVEITEIGHTGFKRIMVLFLIKAIECDLLPKLYVDRIKQNQ